MSDSYIRPDEDFEAFYLKYYKFVYRVCFIYMKNSFGLHRRRIRQGALRKIQL